MKNFKKVSIIIPAYNASNYLDEAIQCALKQTYKNIEIIVVNDGSNDDNKTRAVADKYKNEIKYYEQKNGGVSSALNSGIKIMTGEYFSWLSHDDLYDYKKIEKQMKYIYREKDDDLIIGCLHSFVDKNAELLFNGKYIDNRKNYQNQRPLKYLFEGYINGCDLLINKKLFEKYGLFDEKLKTTQDYDMWFRLLKNKNSKLLIVPEYLVKSRCHEEQVSKAKIEYHVKECEQLWQGMINSLNESEKKSIYGKTYLFYENIYNYLISHTLYKETIKKVYALLIKEIVKTKNPNLIDKYFIANPSVIKRGRKKSVLFSVFGPWDDRGGLNRVVSIIAQSLTDKYEVFVMGYENYGKGYSLGNNVQYINTKFVHDKNVFKLINLLNYLKINIFVGTNNCDKNALTIYEKIKDNGINTILWNHEFYFLPYFNKTYNPAVSMRNKVFKKMDAVLWLNSYSYFVYQSQYSNGCLMPNPLSWEINKEPVHFNKEKDSIVSVARFDDERKCLDKLLVVFSKILEKKPNAKLYVVGKYNLNLKTNIFGKNQSISKLIEILNLKEKNLKFIGQTNEVEKYYAKSKINLVTSYNEGFGLIINEAATYGLPTLGFKGNGYEDLITEGKTGFIIEKNDLDDMAEKVLYLLNSD